MKQLKIPLWCRKQESNFFHSKRCCRCGNEKIYYQEGDGKKIHSLCKKCYNRLNHFCKDEEVFKPICKECEDKQ